MYGYIRPDADELKLREYNEYRAYYCGLCKCLGREYGEAARSVLSYDCTFIALLLSGIAGTDDVYKCRCAYKPLSRPRLAARIDKNILFAADLDILLAYYKAEDDWHDEKKPLSLAARAALSRAKKKAATRQPALDRAISAGLAELSMIEASCCSELDAAADAFARLMKEAALCSPVEDNGSRIALSHMLYHLGRWVYLADAWDDREKDKRRGCYNPFNAAGAGRERAEFLLNCSLNEAIKAYELIDIHSHKEITDNVLLCGCPAKSAEVLGGNNEQSV